MAFGIQLIGVRYKHNTTELSKYSGRSLIGREMGRKWVKRACMWVVVGSIVELVERKLTATQQNKHPLQENQLIYHGGRTTCRQSL